MGGGGRVPKARGPGRGNFARSVNAPGLPAFPSTTTSLSLGPLSFHPNTGPQGVPSLGKSLQEQVPSLGTPTSTGGGGLRPQIPPTSGGAEILRRLTHHSQLGRKENTGDGSKSSSQVLYEHDYQILANSVAGHGLKHQQKY